MKTNLEEKLHVTAARARAVAQRTPKHPVSSIFSFCVLGICAATLIASSQEPAPAPQVTDIVENALTPTDTSMPAARTITDTKGRTLEGTITAKTPTEIRFTRSSDGKGLTIKINSLSQDDQTFIDSLTKKRTSILFFTEQDYDKVSEPFEWLVAQGYDVTFGMVFDPDYTKLEEVRIHRKVPDGTKVIFVFPADVVENYDILWVIRFAPNRNGRYNEYQQSSTIKHARNKRILTLLKCYHKRKADPKFYEPDYEQSSDKYRYQRGNTNYIIEKDDYIFYQDTDNPEETNKTRAELIKLINSKFP